MALMNPGAQAVSTSSENDAQAKKEAYLVRYKEKRAAQRKAAFENALKLRDELAKEKIFDKLSQPVRDFILTLCKDSSVSKGATNSGASLLTTLYGPSPKVGDVFTLQEAFDKVVKGMSTIDMHVKRWAEKGIIVEKLENKQNIKLTAYRIKALPVT